MWLLYAAGSAFFAGITSILAKIGIRRTDSNVATALRTVAVLIFSWLIVLLTGAESGLSSLDGRTLLFLILSGLATGASWLCYYRALQEGPASAVAPVDRLSVLVIVAFSYFVFGEKLTRKAGLGLVLLTAGTVAMAVL